MDKNETDSALDKERLRQQRETFEQRRRQDRLWFFLKLITCYIAILLLLAVFFIAAWILLRYRQYPASLVASAGGALFADVRVALNTWGQL